MCLMRRHRHRGSITVVYVYEREKKYYNYNKVGAAAVVLVHEKGVEIEVASIMRTLLLQSKQDCMLLKHLG